MMIRLKHFRSYYKTKTTSFLNKNSGLIYNTFLASFYFLGFVSCQMKTENNKLREIDHEKINADFGHEVSKLLLDHLYVVVDSATYANLTQNNSWQKKYAALDIGLPYFSKIHDTSSTVYLRGHRHYIEILGPDNAYNEPIGKSGIGFSLKNKDEHFHLGVKPKMKKFQNSILKAHEIVKMPLEEEQKTWFKAFYTPSSGTALHTWYGFYDPTFLNSLYKTNLESYSREVFLESAYTEQKLFNGIKEIHLSCTSLDFQRIVQELASLDSKLLEEEDGNTYTIASGDITVRITFSDLIAYSRITKIICELNHEDHGHTELGHLSITNKGLESVWNLIEIYKHNP